MSLELGGLVRSRFVAVAARLEAMGVEMIEELYTGPATPAERLFFRRFAQAFDALAGREMGEKFYESFPEVLAFAQAGREAEEAAAEWFDGYWQRGELLASQK